MKTFKTTILVLPYLLFFNAFIEKQFYFESLLVFLLLFLFDRLNLLKRKNFIVFSMALILTFFYSLYIFDELSIQLHLRFRFFLPLFFLFCLCISGWVVYKNSFFPFNVFMLFFSLSFLMTKQLVYYKYNDKALLKDFNYQSPLAEVEKSEKPVILIIFDEDSSNKNLFDYTNDTLSLKFDSDLKKKGFYIDNHFNSLSESTGFSLPSIFNFNMHNYSAIIENDEKKHKGFRLFNFNSVFEKNLLVDSLKMKNIKAFSYGLVPFQRGEHIEFDYLWKDFDLFRPVKVLSNNEFLSFFTSKTLFYFLDRMLINKNDHLQIDKFRKDVFDSFKSIHFENNSFYYFHFYAPHAPYSWLNEYSFNEVERKDSLNYLKGHIDYKTFFQKKIYPLLVSEKMKNCRIIISGDHGFRDYESDFNPKKTNLYLYGFDSFEFNSIKNVQNLGYLVNESF